MNVQYASYTIGLQLSCIRLIDRRTGAGALSTRTDEELYHSFGVVMTVIPGINNDERASGVFKTT